MLPRHSILMLALLLLGLLRPALAQVVPSHFMAVGELRRGMRGIGKTVFQGAAIDTFAAEILGVASSILGPRRDLILARLSGGPLASTGVIAGMSGSPVYINGRMIGAVAYAFPFSKIPICGITPVHEMLQVMDRSMEPLPKEQRVWAPFELDSTGAALVKESIADVQVRGPVALEPLATPVWVTGLTGDDAEVLGEVLRPLGLRVQTSPGGRAQDKGEIPFVPGAAIGVQLIAGDLSATGIGTLTHVDGDRIIAFGHPMMLSGSTDMPMTQAYIFDVIPSHFLSSKLGAATLPVGAIRQDRVAAIAGVLGAVPDMLPVEIGVVSSPTTQTYRFEILRHRDLTPRLVWFVLLKTLETTEKLFGTSTLRMRSHIRFSDGRSLEKEQVYGGTAAISIAAEEVMRPLNTLARSPFPGLELEELRVELELSESIANAVVRSLRVGNPELEEGEPIEVEVVLQPYRRPPVEQRLELALPADLGPGPLLLRVGSGEAGERWERARLPDAFRARDDRHLLQLLEYHERNDELIVELYRSQPSLTLEGRELPGLPPSVRSILEAERSSGHLGPVHGQVILRQRIRTDYVLSGAQTLELTLGKK